MAGLHGGAQNSRLSAGRRGCGGRDADSVHSLWLPCFGCPLPRSTPLVCALPTHTHAHHFRSCSTAWTCCWRWRRWKTCGRTWAPSWRASRRGCWPPSRRSAQVSGHPGGRPQGGELQRCWGVAGEGGTLPASLGVGMSACPASSPAWGGPACCPTRRQWATWGTCCRAAERHRATPASDVRLRLVGPLWTLRRAAPELHAQQWCHACRGGWVQLAAQLGSPRVQPLPLTPALPVCTDNMTQLPLAPSLVACRGFNCHRRTLVFRAPEPCFQPSPPMCIE